MAVETVKSFCRFCHAGCAIEVDVDRDANRVVAVRGDKSDPVYEGFTCVKGRHLGHQHHNPDRLRTPLRRGEGGFEAIGLGTALDEIGARIAGLIERHGPRTLASYCGTAPYQNATVLAMGRAFHAAIGSPSFYTSATIDQPAKIVVPLRAGSWGAGMHTFESADVVIVIGMNTVVSHYGTPGTIPCMNPLTSLQRAKKRGTKIIVVDPRRTEVAAHADIHLQVRPGEDPTLLAGLIRVILDEGRYDHAFADRWLSGVGELHAALEPYTLDYVSHRTGIDADLIVEAARMFAAGPRGTAGCGTGPNMAPHPSLTEHLTMCLNMLCGRVNRAGDTLNNAGGAFTPPSTFKAQAVPPKPEMLTSGPAARVKGVHSLRGEAMTGTLAEEILTPGDGQVTALLTVGGNPVVAWPDREATVRALEALDLHVAIDVTMSSSAKLAHYVLASELSLERPDIPTTIDRWFETTYSTYTPAVIRPEGDLIGEWKVYTEIAARLGVAISFPGGTIDPGAQVTADDVLDLIFAKAKVPMAEVRARHAAGGAGALHHDLKVVVAEADEGATARIDLVPAGIPEELAEVHAERSSAEVIAGYTPEAYPFRLSSRRLLSVFNSSGREVEALRAKAGTAFAHVHPDDLAALGLADGAAVEIASPRGAIRSVVKAAADVKPGSVSMAHAWGGLAEESNDANIVPFGDATAALIDVGSGYDPLTAMPTMSAIPVAIRPLGVLAGD